MRYLPKGQRIWADHHLLHKQGRATHDIEITDSMILKEYDDWISVTPLPQTSVDKTFEAIYPDFWIEKNLLKDSAVVPPTTGTVEASDVQVLQALKTIRAWFKQ